MLGQSGVVRTAYDPACGTGGMLSIAKEYIFENINPNADIRLFGQEVNPETYAVCKSDMLIKGDDRDAENIASHSTLSSDGHIGKTFDYQLTNPPFGKDWTKDETVVKGEADSAGGGRFSAGLPRKSDGQMLFLQHMLSKMNSPQHGGGRIAIVMNGSPLFTGDAGSGESEIRRWILENDWLETIVSLPSQLFYNTGIHTYIWVLTNRKDAHRKGKVLLLNGAATAKENGSEKEVFAVKMRKSLGDKRNELAPEHIDELARLAGGFQEGEYAKIFDSTDFGFRKLTIERPLRLNFQASKERIQNLVENKAFQGLAESKKKNQELREHEEQEGREQQETILSVLRTLDGNRLYKNRDEFEKALMKAFKLADFKPKAPIKKAILASLSEKDETADICCGADGAPEPDTSLRDYESVPLKQDIYEYFDSEVKPHVPDAWINEDVRDDKDGQVGKVGYEINFNRYFYKYEPPRPLEEIDADIKRLEAEIIQMIQESAS